MGHRSRQTVVNFQTGFKLVSANHLVEAKVSSRRGNIGRRLQGTSRATISQLSLTSAQCVIACISDFQFIGTAARRLGLTAISNPRLGMLASLDHSIYFYPLPRDFDPSAPLLHVIEAVVVDTEPGRGVVRGRIYTDKGELIAVTMQEGVVRAGGRPKTNMQADRAKL